MGDGTPNETGGLPSSYGDSWLHELYKALGAAEAAAIEEWKEQTGYLSLPADAKDYFRMLRIVLADLEDAWAEDTWAAAAR